MCQCYRYAAGVEQVCATLSYRYAASVVQVCHPVLQVHCRCCTGVPPCPTGTLQVYRCAALSYRYAASVVQVCHPVLQVRSQCCTGVPPCPTGTLQVLYKLKTGKLFDKNKCRNPEPDDDPFAVQHMYMCAESRLLAVAGITHVILFRFCKQEKSADCQVGPRGGGGGGRSRQYPHGRDIRRTAGLTGSGELVSNLSVVIYIAVFCLECPVSNTERVKIVLSFSEVIALS